MQKVQPTSRCPYTCCDTVSYPLWKGKQSSLRLLEIDMPGLDQMGQSGVTHAQLQETAYKPDQDTCTPSSYPSMDRICVQQWMTHVLISTVVVRSRYHWRNSTRFLAPVATCHAPDLLWGNPAPPPSQFCNAPTACVIYVYVGFACIIRMVNESIQMHIR